MARMIPPFVAEDTKSQAEHDIFAMLKRDLSDDWTVLHSVGIAHFEKMPWGEADFVLVGPPGVFVLEVKGGRVRRERGAWIFTNRRGEDSEPKARGPFDQAGTSSAELYALLKRRVPASGSAAAGYGVVTPDIRFTVAGPDVIPEVIYDLDDTVRPIDVYVNRLSLYWRDRLARQRGGVSELDSRTRQEVIDELRPDFDGRVSLRLRANLVKKELLRLTTEQYRVLDGLAANDRAIISGGAGTGKTLLAVEEARRYAAKGQRVALLCFNRNLAEFLQKVVADMPLVRASSMHALLSDIVRRAGLQDQLPRADQDDLFQVFYPDLAYRALVEGLVPDRFDVVIIDEAQDLLAERYLDVVDALLEGGRNGGCWRLFFDPRQDIFAQAQSGALKKLRGVSASYSLSVNCRNTRPIGVETSLLCGMAPGETLRAEGPEVQRRWYEDRGELLRYLGRDVNAALSAGFKPGDMVILGPRRLLNSSVSDGIPGVPFKIAESSVDGPKYLRYSTVQAFKGLEADVVFLVDIDELMTPQAMGMTYVGTSRTRTDLYVYLSGAVREQYQERAAQLGERLVLE